MENLDQNDRKIDTGPEASTEKPERRPTVCVNCTVPNGVTIAHHEIHKSFMGQEIRALNGDMVTLKSGMNPGIDKEWFDAWLDENKNLSIVTAGMMVAVYEPNPDDEQTEEEAAEEKAE